MTLRRALLAGVSALAAAAAAAAPPTNGGPYNAHFLAGGIGIERAIAADDPLRAPDADYSFTAWLRSDARQAGAVPLIALGGPGGRSLALVDGHLAVSAGGQRVLAPGVVVPDRWTFVAEVVDRTGVRLFVDGREVAHGLLAGVATSAAIAVAPVWSGRPHFGGSLVEATLDRDIPTAAAIAARAAAPPAFDLVQMRSVGVGWEFQKSANIGLFQQQDPWTLPHGTGPTAAPRAVPIAAVPALAVAGPGRWQVNGWRLSAAPDVAADGAMLSRPGVDTARWYAATVPGTVLATLVDRGVYPDPYYGLDNLAIPEKLARQDYWYRAAFDVPAAAAGKALRLRFAGVNYAAEVWINGARAGAMRGAFVRGAFTFTPVPGENVVAVRVSPPPHPGIPHEQSIAAGVGENGGQLAIDGPTFVATEGWDWIPGIRDRDTGLWQGVELEATGTVRLSDPQVVTDLPLPRTDSADIYLTVPLINDAPTPRRVTVSAAFDNVALRRTIVAPPGETIVRFTPASDAALHVLRPRLWWPNGYGAPALHDLTIVITDDAGVADRRALRFGIRKVSYDLSLIDTAGRLRRVEVDPTAGSLRGERLVDVRHAAITETPGGWVERLTPAGETSPAVRDVPATFPLPHLTLRVNGVRIAARGGSWGMDDAMKRSGRERLAPSFRLEREAHMNIVRNWMGNNDEPAFFDLADENGMMVLNDFWDSTQDFQVEPQDPALFLANARDTIARYRNHPSIVVWFGRNEGVPYPLLNEGLDAAVAELDGTRWYTGSSNVVNLQGSGPYNYRPPAGYFTDLASGFSVETGSSSLATLEAIAASIPEADRWPLSDTMAYHDWHFSGNGDTATFMAALATMFGPATSLADFERKAQMMNLETYKAIYEGFLGHLWTKNSGRLLWMTHPAWPSNSWQLYSSDWDTSAAYYGAKKATEPLHVQLNLPGNELVAVNTTLTPARVRVAVHVTTLDGRALFDRHEAMTIPADDIVTLAPVPLDRLFAEHPMLLVALSLTDAAGVAIADNFYWRGRDPAAYRALDSLPRVALTGSVAVQGDGDEQVVTVTLANPSATPVLNVKLTLVDAAGARILPSYYSDNYLMLQPGGRRVVTIRYPSAASGLPRVALRGWNAVNTLLLPAGKTAVVP